MGSTSGQGGLTIEDVQAFLRYANEKLRTADYKRVMVELLVGILFLEMNFTTIMDAAAAWLLPNQETIRNVTQFFVSVNTRAAERVMQPRGVNVQLLAALIFGQLALFALLILLLWLRVLLSTVPVVDRHTITRWAPRRVLGPAVIGLVLGMAGVQLISWIVFALVTGRNLLLWVARGVRALGLLIWWWPAVLIAGLLLAARRARGEDRVGLVIGAGFVAFIWGWVVFFSAIGGGGAHPAPEPAGPSIPWGLLLSGLVVGGLLLALANLYGRRYFLAAVLGLIALGVLVWLNREPLGELVAALSALLAAIWRAVTLVTILTLLVFGSFLGLALLGRFALDQFLVATRVPAGPKALFLGSFSIGAAAGFVFLATLGNTPITTMIDDGWTVAVRAIGIRIPPFQLSEMAGWSPITAYASTVYPPVRRFFSVLFANASPPLFDMLCTVAILTISNLMLFRRVILRRDDFTEVTTDSIASETVKTFGLYFVALVVVVGAAWSWGGGVSHARSDK